MYGRPYGIIQNTNSCEAVVYKGIEIEQSTAKVYKVFKGGFQSSVMNISNWEASRQAEKFGLPKSVIVKAHTAYELMILQVEYSAHQAIVQDIDFFESLRRYSRFNKMMRGAPKQGVSGLEERLRSSDVRSPNWFGAPGVAFAILEVSCNARKTKSEPDGRCFHYECSGDTAEVHFSNAVVPKHPLKDEELKQRKIELRDIAQSLKEKHPEVKILAGSSWLRNYKSYISLFPKEHRKTVECDASAVNSMGVWGQFYRYDGTLNEERVRLFKASWEFPLKCLSSECPIESFFRMYLD